MRRDYLFVIGLGLLLFVPFLGGVHLFDWDEINFAECAREMLRSGDWFRSQIDYEPFYEKPPLFFWFQAISMSVFGINEFAARLPNAVCGIVTLLLVFDIGRHLHDRMFGWLWVFAWVGSLLPHLYFRSGIIDPWFNLLIFAGLYGFIKFRWQFFCQDNDVSFWHRYMGLLLGGLALGFAVLTKGPTAILIVFLVLFLYWARYRFRNKGYFSHLVFFGLASTLAALIWFGIEIALHGTWFVEEFIRYQIRLFTTPDSGHGGFFGYHFVVLLLGCFPASIFAIPNLWGDRQPEDEVLESHTLDICKRSDMATWMQLLFWTVLILFSIVRTKIVHYSSLAYFPITYLAAVTIWRAIHWNVKPKIVQWGLPFLGLLIAIIGIALPFVGQNLDLIKPLFSRDPFAMANLEADVTWYAYQALPGMVLLVLGFVGYRAWLQGKFWIAAQGLYTAGAIFVAGTLLLCIRNIEAYSQRAAIEFYKSKSQEDCYIRSVGFKSYGYLYYADKPPVGPEKTMDDMENLLHGNPGKPVYFVAKISNLAGLPELPDTEELYRKNGFVFFKRNSAKRD